MREDSLVRAAVMVAGSVATEDELRARANVSPAIAFRAWTLRRAASGELLAWWMAGKLTLRQAERIALQEPFAPDAQREAAAAVSPVIRAELRSRES